MKKIFCIILILTSILSAKEDKDATKRIALSGMIISGWVAVGITEGVKWRSPAMGGCCDFIYKGDYHVYRGVTGFNLFAVPILALNMDNSSANIKTAIISNLVGWALYEGMISYIGYGDFFHERSDFYVLEKKVPKPQPALATALATLLSLEVYYRF